MRAILLAFALTVPACAEDAVLLDGKPVVTEADLAGWSAAQACYGDDALTSRRAALMRLTEAALAEAAMRRQGGPDVTASDVAKDAERIDRETQAPETLACIKAALKDGYLRVFVRPSYVEATLRRHLVRDAKSPVVQEKWFKSLRKFKLEIRDPELRAWVRSIKGNPRLAAVEVAP